MQPQKIDSSEERAEDVRRSIHDIAAAIISVRALAETLSEHVPTLVAMSRSRNQARQAPISPETLDALPSIPAEIVELCEIARGALHTLGNATTTIKGVGALASYGLERAERARAEPPAGKSDSEGAKVLLVEDEETVRYVLSQTLRAQGCLVTGASDAEEALGLLEEQVFDLVLMDLRIPGMSGWEATERIRRKEKTQGGYMQIVGLTASPLLEDQLRAKASGMDDVLVKPIDESTLKSMLRRFT